MCKNYDAKIFCKLKTKIILDQKSNLVQNNNFKVPHVYYVMRMTVNKFGIRPYNL